MKFATRGNGDAFIGGKLLLESQDVVASLDEPATATSNNAEAIALHKDQLDALA